MKYLPSVRPILAPKLRMLKIYRNLAYLIFQILRFQFKCGKNFMKYLPPVRPKLVPKLEVFKTYRNSADLIFQIYQSLF